MRSILRDDGFLVMSTPNKFNPLTLTAEFFKSAAIKFAPRLWHMLLTGSFPSEAKHREFIDSSGIQEHIHEFSISELESLLEKCEFEVTGVKGNCLPYDFLSPLLDRSRQLLDSWERLNESRLLPNWLNWQFIIKAKAA